MATAMTRYATADLYVIYLVILTLLASTEVCLSLEDFNLESSQLKQNNEEGLQGDDGSKTHAQNHDSKSEVIYSTRLGTLEETVGKHEAKFNELQKFEQKFQVLLKTKLEELQKLFEQKIQSLETKLSETELKAGDLEKKLAEFQKLHEKSREDIYLALNETAQLVSKHASVSKEKKLSRTCREIYQSDPSLRSGMYNIDPDGHGSENPINVYCDMVTGTTSVPHDSENPTNVGHCAAPGCYSKTINYTASMRQMEALAELSSECHQSIQYDCNYAPFETQGFAQSWWTDRNGVKQYFWSGTNSSIHTCKCGINKNCNDSYYLCNCDAAAPFLLSDIGVITDKKFLPITQLNFGRTQHPTSSGVHTLGRFECSGQVSISGMPKSCLDLWKIGHTLSGIYSIMGLSYVESVYCDFNKLSYDKDFQTLIGYADVKTSPVYFYVQKNASHSVQGNVIPFEYTRLNIGGAMNASSGIFTAPRDGIYSFQFSGVSYHPSSSGSTNVWLSLQLNGKQVGRSYTATYYNSSYFTQSLHSTLELKTGDQVWITISSPTSGAYLYDNTNYRHTHFTGYLLQENVANYLKSTRKPRS